jgi:hypothetical protein
MGIELASMGLAPVYCPGARITSASPKRASAARGQRRRWEHGHMSTLLHRGPKLVGRGIACRQWNLLTLGLDLIVPPIALLVVLLCAGALATWGLGQIGGSYFPLALFATAAAFVVAGVFAAWFKFGRSTFPARYILMIPFYVVWKIPLYWSFAFRGAYTTWERAERSTTGF